MAKIITRVGNLLDSTAPILCQQVNCERKMGAGLAKQIVQRYPDVLQAFRNNDPILGGVFLYTLPTGQKLANLYAQSHTRRYDGECCTDYEALRTALHQVRIYARSQAIPLIAIPYGMGCGLAGGDWGVVSAMVENVFNQSGVEVEAWRLPT